MLITFFVILFGGSLALTFTGIKYKRWLLTMMGTILALVCAFQAFEIEVVSGGVTLVFQEIVIVLVCWLLTLVAFVFTLVGMIDGYKEHKESKNKQQLGGPPHG